MQNITSLLDKIKSILNGKSSLSLHMVKSAVCRPISMIVSYIYVPIVLNYLGVEKYGVWSTILTVLSWIGYFDIGIGNGLRNRLTESLSRRDGQSKRLVSSAYAFIAVIMIAVAIMFSVAVSFANCNRIFGVVNIDENLAGVVIISVAFVAINFILSICKNVLYALQRAADVSAMELATQVLNLCGVLIAIQLFKVTSEGTNGATSGNGNLFVMAVVYGMSMILVNLVASIIIYGRNREVSPEFKYVDIGVGKNLTNLGLQFFLIQICALVLFTTDSLIISCLYGAMDVTPYSTVNKLFNALSGIYSALLVPVWSAVTKAKTERNWSFLRNIIKKLRILMMPFVVGTILLVVIFRPLSGWWLGQDLDYAYGLIPLGGAYCFLTIWCNTYAQIANGLELMRVSMVTSVTQAVVNIPLSILFAESFGMGTTGVLCGTVMAMVISAIIQPVAVYRFIGRKKNEQA